MTIARSLKDQLLAHKRLTPSGCWEWNGYLNPEGYGRVQWKGKKYLVHIASAMVYKDYDPATYFTHGLQVNHLCHNRKCFNPSHYYIGTQDDNMNDLVEKNAGITHLTSPPPPTEQPDTEVRDEADAINILPDEFAAIELLRARGYAVVAIHPDEMVEGIDPDDLEDWMYAASDEFQDLDDDTDVPEDDESTLDAVEADLGLT